MRVKKEFDPAYNDITSPKSRVLILEFNNTLVPYFRILFVDFVGFVYKRFYQGSIGMEFDILFEPASNVSNTSIIKAFEDGNSTRELKLLHIIGGITVTEQLPVTEITTQSPSASTAAPTGILLLFLLLA